jgi:outer membrane protein assembly factor BamB
MSELSSDRAKNDSERPAGRDSGRTRGSIVWSRRRLLQAAGAATATGLTARTATAQSDSNSTATGTTVYVGSYDDRLYAVDATTGGQQWEFETGDTVGSSPTVVGGTVYIGSFDNRVYALDAEDGTEQWAFEAGGEVLSSPTVVDGTVYVGSYSDNLYAVDAATGDQQWAFETSGVIWSSPTVVDSTVYVGSWDNNLYAVDATTGDQQWAFETGGPRVWSSPAVIGGTVYVGSGDKNLYAVDAATGDQRWAFETGNMIWSSPTVVDGTVYVGSEDSNVYALDAADGSEEWAFQTGAWVDSSPTVVDDTVYVGSENLYAIDASTGDQQWAFETGGDVESSPTVIDDTVYVGSYDENLYAVDVATGDQQWVFETGDRIYSSPTVVADPANGGSIGSRVNQGTLGHHHVFAEQGPTGPGSPHDPEPKLDASFSFEPEAPIIGDTVTFNAGDSTPADDIQAYRWDVTGDGEVDNTGVTVERIFENPEEQTVRLTVVDGSGNEASAEKSIKPESPDEPDTGPDGDVTGTVADVDGQSVADATVRVYDATEDVDAVLARTTADDDGTYAVADLETSDGEVPESVLLVVRDGEWFGSVGIDNLAEQLPLEYDIELDRQLLFGPEVAADGRELSVLTCWRRVLTRRRQTVFLEAVNLASSGPRHAITADAADLTDGAFALTVLADDAWINFGSQSDVSGTVPGRVETVGLGTSIDHAELADWHPVRTGLPLYQVGSEVDAAFERMSTADADVADVVDEGFGAVAGILPGVSTLLTWLDTVEWAFGERLEAEARLGAETVTFPDPDDPSTTQTRADPNEHTTARLAWRSDNTTAGANEGAVVMAVPVEFQYGDERTTQVTAEAEWTHPRAHVSFGASFDVGPVGTEEAEDD